mmetsp:Transcript_40538/g.104860  ORF Transcript_40538/g.104860 Transcript_40538/m.104860 type:complete len:204 (+) Transcript_40538:271-882(+)
MLVSDAMLGCPMNILVGRHPRARTASRMTCRTSRCAGCPLLIATRRWARSSLGASVRNTYTTPSFATTAQGRLDSPSLGRCFTSLGLRVGCTILSGGGGCCASAAAAAFRAIPLGGIGCQRSSSIKATKRASASGTTGRPHCTRYQLCAQKPTSCSACTSTSGTPRRRSTGATAAATSAPSSHAYSLMLWGRRQPAVEVSNSG